MLQLHKCQPLFVAFTNVTLQPILENSFYNNDLYSVFIDQL